MADATRSEKSAASSAASTKQSEVTPKPGQDAGNGHDPTAESTEAGPPDGSADAGTDVSGADDEGHHDEPWPTEQVRRTDADRWPASFSAGADSPQTASFEPGAATQSWPEAKAQGSQPAWSTSAPQPDPQPNPQWHTDAPASAGSAAGPAGGSAWGPTYGQSASGPYSQSQNRVQAVNSAEQAQPGTPPPPPQAPAYPSVPAYVDKSRDQFAGPPGQRPEQARPPSGWSAVPPGPALPAPPPVPPQVAPGQWQQPAVSQQGWQPAGPQAPPQPQHTSAADLTAGSLVKPSAAVPRAGWRAVVHAVTGGAVNPGLSGAELEHRTLIERITAPVRGCHRIAVVSLKGGIGKTTTTAGLGLTLAEHRGDRVVALDANPDAGTLAERLTSQVDVTVRDLLDNATSIRSFTDVSAFTSLAARLQVLASEQDPEMSEAFSEDEYRTVSDILARYFNIVLTDSGTGLLHSAMSGTLALADTLVVVGSPSVDGASRASKTLDWLIAHGHRELVSRAVAVISTVRPAGKQFDMTRLREHFGARVRAVVEIPYDRHLVTGGIMDLSHFEKPTNHAFLELAANVADGFRLPPLIRPVHEASESHQR